MVAEVAWAFSLISLSPWKLDLTKAYVSGSNLVLGLASTSMPLDAKNSTTVVMPRLNSRATLLRRTGLFDSAM